MFNIEFYRDRAAETFLEEGSHAPIWLLVDRNGQVTPMLALFENDEEKDTLAGYIRGLCQSGQVVEMLTIQECWKKGGKDYEERVGEMLIVRYMSPTCEEFHYAEITRDADGKPSLGPWEVHHGASSEGRFSHFWEDVA